MQAGTAPPPAPYTLARMPAYQVVLIERATGSDVLAACVPATEHRA